MSEQIPAVPAGAVDLGLEPTPPAPIARRQGAFGVSGSGDTSGFGLLFRQADMPGASPPPFGDWFDAAIEELQLALPERGVTFAQVVEQIVVDRGELTIYARRAHWRTLARTLRDEPALRFEVCHSVSGVHYPADQERELHAVIHLLSLTHNRRMRVEIAAPVADPHIPSAVPVWPAADWHERETWDMFGIVFDDHPGLTRILMPDDWPGHPQRKDYPLGGIPVEYKGATIAPPEQRRSYN